DPVTLLRLRGPVVYKIARSASRAPPEGHGFGHEAGGERSIQSGEGHAYSRRNFREPINSASTTQPLRNNRGGRRRRTDGVPARMPPRSPSGGSRHGRCGDIGTRMPRPSSRHTPERRGGLARAARENARRHRGETEYSW